MTDSRSAATRVLAKSPNAILGSLVISELAELRVPESAFGKDAVVGNDHHGSDGQVFGQLSPRGIGHAAAAAALDQSAVLVLTENDRAYLTGELAVAWLGAHDHHVLFQNLLPLEPMPGSPRAVGRGELLDDASFSVLVHEYFVLLDAGSRGLDETYVMTVEDLHHHFQKLASVGKRLLP